MIKRPARLNVIRVALAILAILIALVLGLIVLLVIGIETGPVAFLLGFVTATIPVPLYIALVLWIDRYEAEPPWLLATAFFWGVLVAPFFAFLINTTAGAVVGAVANPNAGETFALVISAPIVEECAKALILFIFFFWQKNEFDGVVDGIVYASLAGLGFAMTENILYYGKAALEHGSEGLTLTLIVRGAFAPFSHPLFTSLTGIGLGLSRQSNNTAIKWITPLVGLLLAIFMHSIWNGSAAIGGGLFLLTYLVVMVPAFLIMLIIILFALRREGRVVQEYLLPDLQRGLLSQIEYDQVSSIAGRMGSSFNAFSSGGVSRWKARRQFNQLASELAFHRCRVARGICSETDDSLAIEIAYVQALQGLVNQLRSP